MSLGMARDGGAAVGIAGVEGAVSLGAGVGAMGLEGVGEGEGRGGGAHTDGRAAGRDG